MNWRKLFHCCHPYLSWTVCRPAGRFWTPRVRVRPPIDSCIWFSDRFPINSIFGLAGKSAVPLMMRMMPLGWFMVGSWDGKTLNAVLGLDSKPQKGRPTVVM